MFDALSESLDPQLFWDYRQPLLGGMLNNVIIFALAAVLASLLAMAVGLVRSTPTRRRCCVGSLRCTPRCFATHRNM